jgi:hypothetical protein
MIHIDVLCAQAASNAMWRATMATEYPKDLRNGAAYRLLRSLAEMGADDVDTETKAELSQYSGPGFLSAVRQACREVGFRYQPQSLQEVAGRVIELMNAPANLSPAEALFAQVQR